MLNRRQNPGRDFATNTPAYWPNMRGQLLRMIGHSS